MTETSASREAKGPARLFLGTMAAGLVLAAGLASVAPESTLQAPMEYGMAEAYEDRILALCETKAQPAMLILGDSRAVAGVGMEALRDSGMDIEKLALAGSGIFGGWATLDRLVACGVRPKSVVMAFGTIHILSDGPVMARIANFDVIKGPRAGHAYSMASVWEGSLSLRVVYKAISILGTELSLLDLALLRPSLRIVMSEPAAAIRNHSESEAERLRFTQSHGDEFFGQADGDGAMPGESEFGAEHQVPSIVANATQAIADLGEDNGFDVQFYVLPVNETAWTGLPKPLLETAQAYLDGLPAIGITPLNDVWYLPNSHFGDPSHVNARGRERVTADFMAQVSGVQVAGGNPGTAP